MLDLFSIQYSDYKLRKVFMNLIKEIYFSYYGEFSINDTIEPTQWPYYDLFAVHKGSIQISINENTYHLTEENALLIPPNTIFSGKPSSKNILASVHHFDFIDHTKWKKPVHFKSDIQVWRQLNYSLELQKEFNGDQHITCSALELVIHLLLSKSQNNPILPFNELAEKIRQNPSANWSLNHVSKQYSLSNSHLRKLFKEAYGIPIGKWIQRIRLDIAANLLIETQKGQKEISSYIGYNDVSHFHEAFQTRYKLTPGQYRSFKAGRF